MNGDGIEQDRQWDPKTQMLVASLEALLRLHHEQLQRPTRDNQAAQEAAAETPPAPEAPR